MPNTYLAHEIGRRRTFAIISHPDAGKTTLTEKLLLLGGAIQLAGAVKGRKSSRMATSDWMKIEQERGISITTSVMQFPYRECLINLLDTPGHEDFSEDTYRTLTAVDSCLMVIDAAKGVEDRTIKLMDVCRLRDTPIFTFINKVDRDTKETIAVLDEIESVLNIQCAPITWPIGTGKALKGLYNLYTDTVHVFTPGQRSTIPDDRRIAGIHSQAARDFLGDTHEELLADIELVKGASYTFDRDCYQAGQMTPVFFGTALANFGVREMLDDLVRWAPAPLPRTTNQRLVAADEDTFSGFVFKIQANMDPKHRDRVAFLRICSGQYTRNMKMKHVRISKDIKIADAVTFLAGDRAQVEQAVSGDIIGLHNHGTIQIGDTFSQGEQLKYTGIPHFAPELFKRVRLRDPLKLKQLQKGLQQLSEEGATQLFRPLNNNDLILGAVGTLQFDVVMGRLKAEYRVDAVYEPVTIHTVRWITCEDDHELDTFKRKCGDNLSLDSDGYLAYLAPTRVNLSLTAERYPAIAFHATREH